MPGVSINYTNIKNNKEFIDEGITTHTPRIEFGSVLTYNSNFCNGSLQVPNDINNKTFTDVEYWKWMYIGKYGNASCSGYDCVREFCQNSLNSPLYVYDHDLEKKMGFGRNWKLPKLEKGHCYISEKLKLGLDIKKSKIFKLKKMT
jgi:hypothetical protein